MIINNFGGNIRSQVEQKEDQSHMDWVPEKEQNQTFSYKHNR